MAATSDTVIDTPRAAPAPGRDAWFHALVSGRRRGIGASLLRAGLTAASMPYGLGMQIRNRLFDWHLKRVHRAAVTVVSIGNLTLGGTGKTPAVEYVARFYRCRARRVAILSRGYGVQHGRNDEAMGLEANLPSVPHLQGADRVEMARIAVEEFSSEVLLLDDGFQHRRLHRDLDLVLVDATNPWGYGRLFPRGLLREPRNSLRRADLVLLTRCDLATDKALIRLRREVERIAPDVEIVESIHAPTRLMNDEVEAPLSLLAERRLAAFCGIGNPEAFRQTLERLIRSPSPLRGRGVRGVGGAPRDVHPPHPRPPSPEGEKGEGTLVAFAAFPDHHAYTLADLDRLRTWAKQLPPDAVVVTTQKDLVKLRLTELDDRPLWALQVALTPTRGQDALDRKLEGILA